MQNLESMLKDDLIPVITVDGPSGVGKGTVSALLADFLEWHLLDSGAIYRALALLSMQFDIAINDVKALVDHAKAMDLKFIACGKQQTQTVLSGEVVNQAIRSEACGKRASEIAVIPEIRQALLQRQKDFRQWPGLVADGRDMGTVVFESAVMKFFLTANSEERAKRRYLQLKKEGVNVKIAALLSDIEKRDERDKKRKIAPLVPAIDAKVIDTSQLAVKKVFELVLDAIKKNEHLSGLIRVKG